MNIIFINLLILSRNKTLWRWYRSCYVDTETDRSNRDGNVELVIEWNKKTFMVIRRGQINRIYRIKAMKRRIFVEKDWKFKVYWFSLTMNSFFNELIETKGTERLFCFKIILTKENLQILILKFLLIKIELWVINTSWLLTFRLKRVH